MSNQQQYNFDVEVGKVLNLMINSLYTNKDVALRELISNAADACDKLRYLAAQNSEILQADEELKISITTDKAAKKLIIRDNGIGMNREDLIQNLGTIARSGTENFIKSLTGDKQKDVQLIGQFGVGFYSSFMIADQVEVISRKFDSDKTFKWVSSGSSSFKIEEANDEELGSPYLGGFEHKEKDLNNLFQREGERVSGAMGVQNRSERGTRIILHLKDEATSDFLDRFHIKHVVQTYSDHINFKIEFIPENLEAGAKIETLNSAAALWKKAKEEITKEQYQNFFKHISHLPGEPFMTIHNNVEGLVSYTNLLFIPATKPFDLFHPDRRTSVKLYVKKVFISEDLNLVPANMRFLRGLVDCDDLPLNISRENLQHSLVLEKIRKSIVNKVLSELKKKAVESEEEYLKFWNNFGAVLKEGLCESSEFREKIFEISRFYSSKSPDKLISLSEYLDRVKTGQDKIYFLTGETVEKIKSSPQLEAFLQKDVEVLFLTDAVDEFWVTVALPYKDKEFQSINRHDVDLENVDKVREKKSEEDENKAKEPELKDAVTSEFEGLIKFIKTTLGDKIKDVRISKKLNQSPVCLAVDAGSMDIRLERFLLEQKQIQAGTAKIFEINPNNLIIKSLNQNYLDEAKKAEVTDRIFTLFDLACIIEDEPIKDAKDFSRRLQSLML
ncbi:MAG: molecular chaperone HtpG [Proteobacteria bacterium]|nr:molecular chaperone HtpG [Pseudomonadota bacterium]